MVVAGVAAGAAQPSEAAARTDAESIWYQRDDSGAPRLTLYFFWSLTCPHCRRAEPVVADLGRELGWLDVESLELTQHPEHRARYARMAAALGETPQFVPAFLYCGRMTVGYDTAATTGARLRSELQACHDYLVAAGAKATTVPAPAVAAPGLTVPVLGAIDPSAVSLPLFTLVIAGLDAFNPCAFFVLLCLLGLLVHAGSRARMAVVGGIFVLFSGLVYFLFMAAWLNLFLLIGRLQAITGVAGALAVIIAAISIKDYFRFGRGASLSIPERAKPRLYERLRHVVAAGGWPAMIVATMTLALAANAYELLCTAGFPMVFTRVLTLNALSTPTYYAYLVAYNLIYVLPLLTIVGLFALTLGARKLTEHGGRLLKLASGLMMLGLGMLLLVAPQRLDNPLIGVALLAVAVGLTAAIDWVVRGGRQRPA
jgi:hypothetical protein